MINRTSLIILLLCASCHRAGSPQDQVLSEDRFQSIYIALLEKSEEFRNLPADTARHYKADSIFQAFNTSERQFRLTVDSYKADPRKWQRFYDGVVKSLDEKTRQAARKPGPKKT